MSKENISSLELRTALAKLSAAEHAIADVRRTLETLETLQAAPAEPRLSAPPPIQPPSGGWPAPTPTPAVASAADGGIPVRPWPTPYPGNRPEPPPPRRISSRPPLTLEQKVVRGIAIGGALITVIGVGLLIALAIQNGWLGPLGRVLGTAIFGAALLGIGLWLSTRKNEATTGVTALITTSYLVFSLLVVALVHWLEWWPELIGALVLILIHICYLAQSRKLDLVWISYAVAVVGGFLAMANFQPEPVTWPILVLPLLSLAATLRSGWHWTRLIASVTIVVLHLFLLDPWSGGLTAFAAGLAAVSALALAAANVLDPLPEEDTRSATSSRWAMAAETTSWNHSLVQLALATVLLAVLAFTAPDTLWSWLTPVVSAGFILFGVQLKDRATTLVGLCALPLSFLPLWWNPPTMAEALRSWGASPVLAVFLVIAIGMVWWMSTKNTFGAAPWAAWLFALLLMTGGWGFDVVAKTPLWLTGTPALVLTLLLAALIARVLMSAGSFTIFDTWQQVLGGVAALFLSMLVIVTLATYLGELLGGNEGMWLGYLIGHAVISIIWMVLAAWMLLAHTSLSDRTSLGIGVILASAASLKLVFFDLSALDGVPRVSAFLVCGVALLVIATMRSRRSPALTGDPSTAPVAPQNQPTGTTPPTPPQQLDPGA
ncbi:hypothetical protein [Corynebacterium sp. A21]|uniref:hypothetical protein n=1 Tax=Corynebacterium sp. A21 TaxID=3457318 RepID=UPI003FD12D30